MNNREFTALLEKTGNAAEKHAKLCRLVNNECLARHGVTYSDVDADSIIDVLDYHGGYIIAIEFDEIMTEAINNQ